MIIFNSKIKPYYDKPESNMNKILFFLVVISFISTTYAQEKSKKVEAIDQEVLNETIEIGYAGVDQSQMSDYASEEDLKGFLNKYPDRSYFVFPESKENSIRLLDGIPQVWINRRRQGLNSFRDSVRPGTFFVFQIGVFASHNHLNQITVEYTDLKGKPIIPKSAITCFNLEGTDHLGKQFAKTLSIDSGKVLPLWISFSIPESASGVYKGSLKIKPKNEKPTTINLRLKVSGAVEPNHGFDDGRNLSRLKWLNSTIAHDYKITTGFKPLSFDLGNKSISILGRKIILNKYGLPEGILSYFGPNNQNLLFSAHPIISDRFNFIIELESGEILTLKSEEIRFQQPGESSLIWNVTSHSDEVILTLHAKAEFDGYIDYQLEVEALQDLHIKDIRLEIPMTLEMSKYMMGMNMEGRIRPENWRWKWDVRTKSQDGVWIGGVNGGLKVKLKGVNYHRQLINIYYEYHALNLPDSWGNHNRGGAEILTNPSNTLFRAYSGRRHFVKGQKLHFDFELLVTPLKLIDKNIQFNDRYYHPGSDNTAEFVDYAKSKGANIINIHHRKDINPFINYPYITENIPVLRSFINDAHEEDIRVKLYYTTRELTVNIPEIWAMRSLGGEIIFPGPGPKVKTVINRDGPHPWLIQNFKENFIPAWKTVIQTGPYKGYQDLSVITTPDSRLNNFYLEGLNWMVENLQIDGVYIDDSALDRETLKRARKIIDRGRPNARIDLHSWNHYNRMAGFACCLNLYMELLPYVDLIWIGEGRDYNRSADYWLIEVSGIPFGVTSQMLQHGGNAWRGMVFGITNRLGWHQEKPDHIWKFWDKHRIVDMEMLGFWDANCPVKPSNPKVKATVFKGDNKTLISMANWTDKDQSTRIQIDWPNLDLDPQKVIGKIPYLENFQEARDFQINEVLQLEGGKGFILLLEQ